MDDVLHGVRDGVESGPHGSDGVSEESEAPCRLSHSQVLNPSADPLHEEQLLVLCNRDELVELFQIEGEWFLAKDVFSAEKRTFGVGVMESVRGTDVDGIDVLVGFSGDTRF